MISELRGTTVHQSLLSYHKLKEAHDIYYDEAHDTSPTLTFTCMDGHYVMDLNALRQAYVVTIASRSAKY